MVKVDDMNVFDVLNSTDKRCMVRLYLNDNEIYEGCPDDMLRSLSYEEAGTRVKAMGFDFDIKMVIFDCRQKANTTRKNMNKSITDEIPYENEDTLQDKLDRISYLERMGRDCSLMEWEIEDLDRLYMEIFGRHISEERKKLYR